VWLNLDGIEKTIQWFRNGWQKLSQTRRSQVFLFSAKLGTGDNLPPSFPFAHPIVPFCALLPKSYGTGKTEFNVFNLIYWTTTLSHEGGARFSKFVENLSRQTGSNNSRETIFCENHFKKRPTIPKESFLRCLSNGKQAGYDQGWLFLGMICLSHHFEPLLESVWRWNPCDDACWHPDTLGPRGVINVKSSRRIQEKLWHATQL